MLVTRAKYNALQDRIAELENQLAELNSYADLIESHLAYWHNRASKAESELSSVKTSLAIKSGNAIKVADNTYATTLFDMTPYIAESIGSDYTGYVVKPPMKVKPLNGKGKDIQPVVMSDGTIEYRKVENKPVDPKSNSKGKGKESAKSEDKTEPTKSADSNSGSTEDIKFDMTRLTPQVAAAFSILFPEIEKRVNRKLSAIELIKLSEKIAGYLNKGHKIEAMRTFLADVFK